MRRFSTARLLILWSFQGNLWSKVTIFKGNNQPDPFLMHKTQLKVHVIHTEQMGCFLTGRLLILWCFQGYLWSKITIFKENNQSDPIFMHQTLGWVKKPKVLGFFQQQIFPIIFVHVNYQKKISAQSELIQGSLKSPIFSKNRPIGDNWTENALFALFTLVYLEVLKFERCGLKISVSNNVLVYLTNKKRIRLIS